MYQEKIIKILENHLGVAKILPYDGLYTTLAMDSFDVLSISVAIEIELDLVPNSVYNFLTQNPGDKTVDDLIVFVTLEKTPLKQTATRQHATKTQKKQGSKTVLSNAALKKLFKDTGKMR